MQAVPSEFVCQLRPLLFVAGLGADQQDLTVFPVGKDSSLADPFQDLIRTLRQTFTTKKGYPLYDVNSTKRNINYNVILVEKNVRFPPRKARLQNGQVGPHSPISPFTPSSPLFPDGLMAPIWIRKHRELIPSAFVLVLRLYEFGGHHSDSALDQSELEAGPLDKEKVERVRDNDMVNEIINRKRVCAERGIKLAVVLLASREMLEDAALDNRLSSIRRLSGLDSRASLFVLTPVASGEVRNFVASLQTELAESSIDYYREHGRRLRRKRARPANTNPAVSISSSTLVEKPGSPSTSQPTSLSNAALNVRYEFKAAVFAEFRQEIEVCLKHYEDCYNALLELFVAPTSPGVTVPFIQSRTKRWAEARVLADCINVKVCKMYLYADNAAYAVSTYQHHIHKLAHFSKQQWNMGEDNFEYWSWESKQHRIFGDLLETAIAAGFQIPQVPGPIPGPPLQARASAQHVPAHVLSHPGAYYMKAGQAAEKRRTRYIAARHLYETLYQEAISDPTIEEPPKMTAALAHEQSVQHAEQIIELYTRSYDHYKRARGTRTTLYLANLIALIHHAQGSEEVATRFDIRISRTYRMESWSQILFAILIRSIEATRSMDILRDKEEENVLIPQTPEAKVENEKNSSMHALSNSQSHLPKRQLDLGDYFRMCLESAKLHVANHMSTDVSSTLGEFISRIALGASGPTKTIDITFEAGDVGNPIQVHTLFWRNRCDLGNSVPYQVQFTAPAILQQPFDAIKFESIRVHFSDGSQALLISNDNDLSSDFVFVQGDPPNGRASVRNVLAKGGLTGSISCSHTSIIHVSSVGVSLLIGERRIALHLNQDRPIDGDEIADEPRWRLPAADGRASCSMRRKSTSLARTTFRACSFEPRRLRLRFETRFGTPAYVGSVCPLLIQVWNEDETPITLHLDALLQPSPLAQTATDDAASDSMHLTMGDQGSLSIANALLVENLGSKQSHTSTIYVNTQGNAGLRTLDISLIATETSHGTEEQQERTGVTELSRQLLLQVEHPFFCDFDFAWRRRQVGQTHASDKGKRSKLLSASLPALESFGYFLNMSADIGVFGEENLFVRDVKLQLDQPDDALQILGSTVEESDVLEQSWESRSPLRLQFELLADPRRALPSPGTLDIYWRRESSDVDPSKTIITKIKIPHTDTPKPNNEPIVLASYPASISLHEFFQVHYQLECPSDWRPGPVQVSYQMESATENFVFSGPRKVQRKLILQDPECNRHPLAIFQFIATGTTGLVELPIFRCWQILETPLQHQQRLQALEQEFYDPETGQAQISAEDSRLRMKELEILPWALPLSNVQDDEEADGSESIREHVPLQVYITPR